MDKVFHHLLKFDCPFHSVPHGGKVSVIGVEEQTSPVRRQRVWVTVALGQRAETLHGRAGSLGGGMGALRGRAGALCGRTVALCGRAGPCMRGLLRVEELVPCVRGWEPCEGEWCPVCKDGCHLWEGWQPV